jgi:hypothetical protein
VGASKYSASSITGTHRTCNRREFPARRLANPGDSEDAVGLAGSAHLDGYNPVPGVEFRVRRFTIGWPLWSSNGADRDDSLHIFRRDGTFCHRGASRDEALAGTSALREVGFKVVVLRQTRGPLNA